MTDTPAQRLQTALADRYRLERELGQGGMATVWLAHDLKHDRKVALKVLKPELAAVLGAERFVVEIRTTAALQHPHILPLFDSGTADGFLYYVMPFIDGETLRSKLDRETQLGVDEAVRLAREVADALDYAHRHGVIHRDIKPENILLHDGRPMVADFGIALAVSAAAGGRMTETGLSLGTPHYMSPEQATAEKEITARSDVYSLGSVLYEMLAGEPPHLGNSAQQIIMKIITEPAAPVTKLRKSVPPHVAAAVAKALEKLPADRFASARDFAEALGNPVFGTGTQAFAAGVTPVGARGGGVPRWLFATTAVVAALALVGAGTVWMRPAPEAEVTRSYMMLPEGTSLATSQGTHLDIAPDGRAIALAAVDTTERVRRLYLRRFDKLEAEPIPGTDGAFNPAFSPDGTRLAFVAGNPRALKVISLASGTVVTLTDSLVDNGGVAWGSDGWIYYDGHLEGDGLARIRETGGKPERATVRDSAGGESWHSRPFVLPDGNGVLFSIARQRGNLPFDVAVLDTRTGRHRVLLQGQRPMYSPSGHLLFTKPDGMLMAVPFDAARLEVTGEVVAVSSGVASYALGRTEIAISRTGTLAYRRGGEGEDGGARQTIWITREGRAAEADSTWRPRLNARTALSPDGRRVVVSQLGTSLVPEVWVKELDRGPAWKLADRGRFPAWSSDGRRVFFVGDDGIYEGPADGSVLPALRLRIPGGVSALEMSPDGRWLTGTFAGDIVAIPSTLDTARYVVASPAVERQATISPDGRWLAYSSEETGQYQVYVRPFPETATAKRQVSAAGGWAPRWSRDGRELFYVNGRSEVVAVPVQLAPTFSSGAEVRLFDAEPYSTQLGGFDVSPDGRRFLLTREFGHLNQARDRIVVVQRLDAELRRLAAK